MVRLIACATLLFLSSSLAHAGDMDKYKPQMYNNNTVTSTTKGGTVDTSKKTFIYGQSSTFNSGNNPRNDQTTRSVGVGVRY